MDLAALVARGHTALVTQECQNGVIGEQAVFRELAVAARAGMIGNDPARHAALRRGEPQVPTTRTLSLRRT